MKRQEVIDALTSAYIQDIINGYYDNDLVFIDSILKAGWEGFEKLTDAQLETEYYNQFEKEVQIQ